MESNRRNRGFPWGVALIGTLLAALTGFLLLRPSDTAPWFGQTIGQEAPPLRLTDHHGQPFSLEQWRDKVVLINFGFTHCPNICPTTLTNLAAAFRKLSAEEQTRVRVLFITLDPERDTVAKLAEYMPFFHPGFLGLTGSVAEIARAAKDYGVFYEKSVLPGNDGAKDYTLNHSSYTYLIAPGGKWKLLYDYDQVAKPAELAKDIRRVLE